MNTRGGGDLGSGNLTCNVARAVSRRDVLVAVCYMHGARGCVLHGARGCVAIRNCVHTPRSAVVECVGNFYSFLGPLQWNMFQNRFRQGNLEHSDPW